MYLHLSIYLSIYACVCIGFSERTGVVGHGGEWEMPTHAAVVMAGDSGGGAPAACSVQGESETAIPTGPTAPTAPTAEILTARAAVGGPAPVTATVDAALDASERPATPEMSLDQLVYLRSLHCDRSASLLRDSYETGTRPLRAGVSEVPAL